MLYVVEALAANDVPVCAQEEQRELAKTIRVSGSILLSTVSNFLDFFKMEAGKQLDVVRTEITTKVMPSPLPPPDIPLDWFCHKRSANTSLMTQGSCSTVLSSWCPCWSLLLPADTRINIHIL